jgi:hypothetical protein
MSPQERLSFDRRASMSLMVMGAAAMLLGLLLTTELLLQR